MADYSGDLVPMSAVEECVSHASALQEAIHAWLQQNRPELLAAALGREIATVFQAHIDPRTLSPAP